MDSQDLYSDLKKHRHSCWQRVVERKMTPQDFVFTSFNYLRQQRYKPIVKAHDRNSIMYNYLYWLIQIERKIVMERQLMDMNLGDEDLLNRVIFMYIKRRDQMVRRILWEKKEKVKDAYLVFGDTVEILLESGEILYSSLENLEKIRIVIKDVKKSIQPLVASLLQLK